jgi:hypothetical protein
MPTPPREPPTQLTQSVIEEIKNHRALAGRDVEARKAVTIVPRPLASHEPSVAEEDPFRGVPVRKRRRRAWLAGALLLVIVGAFAVARGLRGRGIPLSTTEDPAESGSVVAALPTVAAVPTPAPSPAAFIESDSRDREAPPEVPPSTSPAARFKPGPSPSIAPVPLAPAPSSSSLIKPTFQVQN